MVAPDINEQKPNYITPDPDYLKNKVNELLKYDLISDSANNFYRMETWTTHLVITLTIQYLKLHLL